MANEELEKDNTKEDSSELELVEIDENKDLDEESQTQTIEQNDTEDEDTQEYEVQRKLGKIQKILIAVVGLLFLIVIIGAVLYFMGYFDPEPQPVQKTKTQKEIKKDKKYHFKPSDININRLNRKLSLLTKYELVLDEVEETKPKEEKKPQQPKKDENIKKEETTNIVDNKVNSQAQEEEKQTVIEETVKQETKTSNTEAIEEKTTIKEVEANGDNIKDNKTNEETIANEQDMKKENPISQTATKQILEKPKTTIQKKPVYKGEEFLKFIQVATLKYKLYKSFINQVKAIDARISVCAYKNNKTQIFIGPFNDENKRDDLVKKINSSVVNDAFKIEFTKEEFNKRCSF